MSDAYQKLEHLIEFPAIIDFRVIVIASDTEALDKVKLACDRIEHGSVHKITEPPRKSRNGQYLSYTVPVRIKSPKHLKIVYENVGALDCVKHIM